MRAKEINISIFPKCQPEKMCHFSLIFKNTFRNLYERIRFVVVTEFKNKLKHESLITGAVKDSVKFMGMLLSYNNFFPF